MTTSTTSSSQELLHNFHPRKFLLNSSVYPVEIPAISPTQENNHPNDNYIHENAAILLLIFICSIMSALGLFLIVKCAVRGSSSTSEPGVNPSAKLANVGVEKKALNAFPTVKYATELKLPGLDTACVICLSEFADGEHLRILPKCNHGFHTRCIDEWLSSHSSCPTCRHCLTDHGNPNSADSSEQSLPVQQSINIEDH